MKITFGKALDGTELRPANDSLGDIVCGPLRLMEILETQLGLRRKPVSDVTRIFQFVKVLETLAGNKPRFYSASFEKDQLSVSETLLHWRDSLVLAGWNGNANGGSKRLHDLADINAALTNAALPGQPDRLVAIRDSLVQRNHGIEDIVVVDPPAAFSRLWGEILTKLSARFRIPERGLGATHNEQQTDLQQLASALDSTSREQIKWQNDGTVIQFSAYSEFTLAHMATELLRENPKEACALVAENDCGPLDDVLIAADQASLGVHSTSLARPIPQLLLLVLRLCWKPLNPLHLLEFLTHPDTPVEFHLRNELSRALVECPGIAQVGNSSIPRVAVAAIPGGVRRLSGAAPVFDDLWSPSPRFRGGEAEFGHDVEDGLPLVAVAAIPGGVSRSDKGRSLPSRLKKVIRAADAKEGGMGNPNEETCCSPESVKVYCRWILCPVNFCLSTAWNLAKYRLPQNCIICGALRTGDKFGFVHSIPSTGEGLAPITGPGGSLYH